MRTAVAAGGQRQRKIGWSCAGQGDATDLASRECRESHQPLAHTGQAPDSGGDSSRPLVCSRYVLARVLGCAGREIRCGQGRAVRSCVLSCRVLYGFDLCLPRLGIARALTHAYAEHVARRSVLLSCAPYDDDATWGLNGDASTTGLPGREHGLSSRARARAPDSERASER